MSTVLTDDNARIYISANVNTALDRAGMSQTELARRTQESDARISLVRRGVHIPSSALLARIAEALGVSADWLLSPPEPPAKSPAAIKNPAAAKKPKHSPRKQSA